MNTMAMKLRVKSDLTRDEVRAQLQRAVASNEGLQQQIQQAAYFKWLAQTDGEPVSEEDTVRYWCEAEQEFLQSQIEGTLES